MKLFTNLLTLGLIAMAAAMPIITTRGEKAWQPPASAIDKIADDIRNKAFVPSGMPTELIDYLMKRINKKVLKDVRETLSNCEKFLAENPQYTACTFFDVYVTNHVDHHTRIVLTSLVEFDIMML